VKPEAVARAEELLGAGAAVWTARPNLVGATSQERWVVQLEGGGSVFVKAATDEASAGWIRAESRVYLALDASFLPRVHAYDDLPLPLLVLEDLAGAHWPPPWAPEHVAAARAALAEVVAVEPPPRLPRLDDQREGLAGWELVAADPEPFLALGLCAPAWLEEALPALVRAAAAAPLDGDALVHLDVRSDNLCVREGRAVLVDWNQASIGNPLVDAVLFAPSLADEGGPQPHELVPPGTAPELVALAAGFWAARAGLPAPPWGPGLRPLQLRQLRVALPWAAAELGLEPPRAPIEES
jgi:hypothetical protein